MLRKITIDEWYKMFNFEYHSDTAGHVLGQFYLKMLFFVFRIPQELGETVIHVDKSILPNELIKIGMEVVDSWKDNLLLQFNDSHEVSTALKNLIKQQSKH